MIPWGTSQQPGSSLILSDHFHQGNGNGQNFVLTGIENYYGFRFPFLLHNALSFVDFQNAIFTIMVFLSCLGCLTAWWMVSKKEHSKRKEMEAVIPLRAGSEILEHHSHHVLLVKAITGPELRSWKINSTFFFKLKYS